jgi:hypothetical protein
MADTGENRQIIGRATAKEAETVRASKQLMSEERATEKAGDIAFGRKKDSAKQAKSSKQKPTSHKASKR